MSPLWRVELNHRLNHILYYTIYYIFSFDNPKFMDPVPHVGGGPNDDY